MITSCLNIERNYIVIVSETGYKQNKKEIEIVLYADKRNLTFTLSLARITILRLFNKINITEESGNMEPCWRIESSESLIHLG